MISTPQNSVTKGLRLFVKVTMFLTFKVIFMNCD